MTVEEAKQELQEYRENINYLKEKQEDLIELNEIITNSTSRIIENKTSNTNSIKDKFGDAISKIEEIKKDNTEKIQELLLKKFVIDNKINQLKYPHRDILYMRYSRGKDWTQIAKELKYSLNNVYKIHGRALQFYSNL